MGYQVVNWDKVRFISNNLNMGRIIDPRDIGMVQGAVNHFMRAPEMAVVKARENALKVQEFTTSGDFPTQLNSVIKTIHAALGYDMGWQTIFDVIDMTGSTGSGFDMSALTSSLTFKLTAIGEKCKYYEMSGTKVTVPFEYYSGGLLWHRSLFTDQQYWTIDRNAIEFRNKLYYSMAQIHYGLIEALPVAQNIAWQLPDPAALPNTAETYTANRDAQTINLACQTILLANADKGYTGINPDGAGTQFIISCPIQLKSRLQKAVSLVLQSFQGSEKAVSWNITIQPTTLYAATDVYYVILPKNNWVHGNKMLPETYVRFDQDSLSDAAACWRREGVAIADTEQAQRCATA